MVVLPWHQFTVQRSFSARTARTANVVGDGIRLARKVHACRWHQRCHERGDLGTSHRQLSDRNTVIAIAREREARRFLLADRDGCKCSDFASVLGAERTLVSHLPGQAYSTRPSSLRIPAVAVLVLLAGAARAGLVAADLAPARGIARIARGGGAIVAVAGERRRQRRIGERQLVLARGGVDLVGL